MKTSWLSILGIIMLGWLWIPVALRLQLDPMVACGWWGLIILGLVIVSGGPKRLKTRPQRMLGSILLVGGLLTGSVGTGQLFGRAQYESSARIRVDLIRSGSNQHTDTNESDISLRLPDFQAVPGYISSPAVLTNVVESLDLNVKWGRKYGNGGTLTTAQTEAMIRRQLIVRHIWGTRNAYRILVTGDDPNEAAELANAIGSACQADSNDLQQARAVWDPPFVPVKMVEYAKPPLTAIGPDRVLGAWSLAGGLLAVVVGSLILRHPWVMGPDAIAAA